MRCRREWDVELYRNSALVGYAAAGPDGRYVFDVPILYGTNPVELVAHGPTGEVRRFSHTFEVGPERLAARQFEYGIAAGGCGLDPCDGTLNLDARYGATRTVTLRAGYDWFWRDNLLDSWPEPPYRSWRTVRWALSDAASQLFRSYFTIDQVPQLIKFLNDTAADLHKRAALPPGAPPSKQALTPVPTAGTPLTPTPSATARP